MLLDTTCHIVVGMGAYHQTILSLTIHGLRINVIMFLRILHQPTFVLKLLEVLGSLLVDARVVLAGAYGEVNLGLDDVIETLFVVASFGACLL